MISIVIPTYNRADILTECLEHLSRQTCARERFEVIVVNDGGTDSTVQVVQKCIEQSLLDLKYFEKNNEGQGIARNFGVERARGDIVAFIGDDILVTPTFVEMHLKAHDAHPEEASGVLGFIEWDPRLPQTPLYRFLTNGSAILGRYGGHQFAYEKLDGKQEATYDFFYTSNISLKTSLLKKFPFDASFLKYGWEDIALGYQLVKDAGFHLFYEKEALAHHFHPMDELALKKRMYAIGKAAILFDQKYPELQKIPKAFKKFLLQILGSRPMIGLFYFLSTIIGGIWYDWYYFAISKKYFLEGISGGKISE